MSYRRPAAERDRICGARKPGALPASSQVSRRVWASATCVLSPGLSPGTAALGPLPLPRGHNSYGGRGGAGGVAHAPEVPGKHLPHGRKRTGESVCAREKAHTRHPDILVALQPEASTTRVHHVSEDGRRGGEKQKRDWEAGSVRAAPCFKRGGQERPPGKETLEETEELRGRRAHPRRRGRELGTRPGGAEALGSVGEDSPEAMWPGGDLRGAGW